MPDVWTRHPDVVRDLLKEAGFKCGAAPRFLKPRDPEWTCIIDTPRMKGDLYIHHVGTLKSDAPTLDPLAALTGPALLLLLGAVAIRHRRRRPDDASRLNQGG